MRRRLDALEAEEKVLSGRRKLVQDRILFIRGNGLEHERVAQLQQLDEQEALLSTRRRELHGEIDQVRARLGLPPWTPPPKRTGR